jgi:hypothetical protein
MSELQPIRNKSVPDPRTNALMSVLSPSLGVGKESTFITRGLKEIASNASPSSFSLSQPHGGARSIDEQLYDALASAKIITSQISMHLEKLWRDRVFARLDELLSIESWDQADKVLDNSSYSTFLRTILFLKPAVQPNFGISHRGHLLADWTTGRDSLVLEFLPSDEVRWVLVRYIDGERESAAGQTPLRRISAVLEPYAPERWFTHAAGQSPA